MADSRSITRRLFMRHGAAAGAALSTTAFTSTTVQAARASRFAEVTAAFDAAHATFLEAIDAENVAEQEWLSLERRDVILGPKIDNGRNEISGRDADEAYEYQERQIVAEARKLRKGLEAIGGDTAVVDAWELLAKQKAMAAVEQWSQRRAACGYTAAQNAATSAMEGETDALLAVLSYRPVSQDDARAKVKWICGQLKRLDINGLHGAFECLLESSLPEGEELHEQDNGTWIIASGGVS